MPNNDDDDEQYRPTALSGRPRCACTLANVNQVEDLTLIEEDKLQTHNCATDWHIFGSLYTITGMICN